MLMILSPSKTLDFSPNEVKTATQPVFQKEISSLVKVMKKLSPPAIGELMEVSDKIAGLNYERYQHFSDVFDSGNSKQALLAFKGDVYLGFELEKYTEKEYEYAQSHLRILSGLYGLLMPLDYIQPYRLEMGIGLKNPKGKNLYEFWGDKITKGLNAVLEAFPEKVLINLASQEYFGAVKPEKIKGKVITIHFKELRNGKLQVISFNAKKARGKMANYAIRNHLTDPEALKSCTEDGYVFHPGYSGVQDWVFVKG